MLTLISGRLRISGKVLRRLLWATSVCSLGQRATVEGMLLRRFPLRFSSSSCSSLLSLLPHTDRQESIQGPARLQHGRAACG